jgi:hypothetical protein
VEGMTMPVTDEQEATLHAQLAGNFDEYVRLLDSLDPVAARTGYSALVSAAFSLAADERFPEASRPPRSSTTWPISARAATARPRSTP